MSYEPPPLPPPVVYPLPPQPALPVGAFDEFPRRAKPGLVTAIGVLSVVIGVLSVLANVYTLGVLFIFSMMSNFSTLGGPPMQGPGATATTQPTPVAGNAKAVVVSKRGLEADDRRAAAEGLSYLRSLTPQRLDQLDALLAEAGRDIFPLNEGEQLQAGRMADLVLGHATGLSADPNVAGPDTFRTAGGRFELYDNRAVYYPQGRGEVVRTSTLTGSTAGLTPEQIETVVRQAQSTAETTLNPSQVTALRTLLGTPGQPHVSQITLPTAIRSVQEMGDGSVLITFPNGFANIGPQGQTVTNNTNGPAGAAVMLPGGRVRHSGAGMALAGFATLAELGLAVYLLVIGTLTLRESPRGRSFHLLYAGIKIALALTGAVAAWWMATTYRDALLANTSPRAAEARDFAGFVAVQAVIFGVVALIYPLALLVALQTRRVKDFYQSIR